MDTETLASWKNIAQVTAFCLAGLAALAAGVVWFAGRELDRRHAADEAYLHDRVASSEAAAVAARRDADQLRQQLAPRVLSALQREKIINELHGLRGQAVVTYPPDEEAEAFARQLHEAIAAAGWTAFLESASSFDSVAGVSMKVRSLETPPPALRALYAGLEAALGSIRVTTNQDVAPDAIEITVGSKPTDD